MNSTTTKAVILLTIGCSFFGFLGIFTRHFNALGFDAIMISLLRTAVMTAVILPLLLIFNKGALRIGLKGMLLILMFSMFKLISDILFFFALGNTPLSLATMLQMTSPYYVLILSFFLFKEAITLRKIAAMIIAFIGCTLLTGGVFSDGSATAEGIIMALISGLTLGIYMLGATVSYSKGYNPSAYLLYSALFGTLMVLPFIDYGLIADTVTDLGEWPYILGLGIVASFIPLFLEAWAVKYLLPTTISVVALMEIISATVIGALVFGEILSVQNALGIGLVMSSILFINAGIFHGFRKYVEKHPEALNVLNYMNSIPDILKKKPHHRSPRCPIPVGVSTRYIRSMQIRLHGYQRRGNMEDKGGPVHGSGPQPDLEVRRGPAGRRQC